MDTHGGIASPPSVIGEASELPEVEELAHGLKDRLRDHMSERIHFKEQIADLRARYEAERRTRQDVESKLVVAEGELHNATLKAQQSQTHLTGYISRYDEVKARYEEERARRLQLEAELDDALDENEQAKRKMHRNDKTIQSLEEEVARLNDTIQELHHELGNVRSSISRSPRPKRKTLPDDTVDIDVITEDSTDVIHDTVDIEEMARLSGENVALKAQVLRMESDVAHYRERESSLQDESNSIRKENMQLTQQLSMAETQIGELRDDLSSALDENGKHKQTIQRLERHYSESQEKLARAEATLTVKAGVEKRCALFESDVMNLRLQVEQLQTENAVFRQEQLESATSYQYVQTSFANEDITVLEDTITELQISNRELTTLCDAFRADEKKLTSKLESINLEKDEFEKVVSQLQDRNSSLKEELARTSQQRESLRGDLTEERGIRNDLETTLTKLADEMKDLQDSKTVADSQVTTLSRELREAQEEVSYLTEKVSSKTAETARLKEQVSGVQKELAAARNLSTAKVQDLRSEVEDLRAQRDEFIEKYDDNSAKYRILTARLTSALSTGEALTSTNEQLEEQLRTTKTQLTTISADHQAATEELVGLRQEITLLRDMRDTLTTARSAVEALKKDKRQLQVDLNISQEELDLKIREISQLRTLYDGLLAAEISTDVEQAVVERALPQVELSSVEWGCQKDDGLAFEYQNKYSEMAAIVTVLQNQLAEVSLQTPSVDILAVLKKITFELKLLREENASLTAEVAEKRAEITELNENHRQDIETLKEHYETHFAECESEISLKLKTCETQLESQRTLMDRLRAKCGVADVTELIVDSLVPKTKLDEAESNITFLQAKITSIQQDLSAEMQRRSSEDASLIQNLREQINALTELHNRHGGSQVSQLQTIVHVLKHELNKAHRDYAQLETSFRKVIRHVDHFKNTTRFFQSYVAASSQPVPSSDELLATIPPRTPHTPSSSSPRRKLLSLRDLQRMASPGHSPATPKTPIQLREHLDEPYDENGEAPDTPILSQMLNTNVSSKRLISIVHTLVSKVFALKVQDGALRRKVEALERNLHEERERRIADSSYASKEDEVLRLREFLNVSAQSLSLVQQKWRQTARENQSLQSRIAALAKENKTLHKEMSVLNKHMQHVEMITKLSRSTIRGEEKSPDESDDEILPLSSQMQGSFKDLWSEFENLLSSDDISMLQHYETDLLGHISGVSDPLTIVDMMRKESGVAGEYAKAMLVLIQTKASNDQLRHIESLLSQSNSRSAELQHQLNKSKAQTKSLKDHVSQLMTDISEKDAQVKDMSARIGVVENKRRKAENQCKAYEAQIARLDQNLQHLDSIAATVQELRGSQEELELQNSQLQHQIVQKQEQIREQTTKFSTTEHALLEKISSLVEQLTVAEHSASAAKANEELMRTEKSTLAQQLRDARSGMEVYETRVSELEATAGMDASQEETIKTLRSDITSKTLEVAELRDHLNQVERSTAKLLLERDEKFASLQSERDNISQELQMKERELRDTRTSLQKVSEKLGSFEARPEDALLRDENAALKSELAKFKRQLSVLADRFNELEEEKARLERESGSGASAQEHLRVRTELFKLKKKYTSLFHSYRDILTDYSNLPKHLPKVDYYIRVLRRVNTQFSSVVQS